MKAFTLKVKRTNDVNRLNNIELPSCLHKTVLVAGFPKNFKSLESYKVTEDLQMLRIDSV